MLAMAVGMLVGLIGGGIIGGGVAGIGGSLVGMLGGVVGVGATFIIIFRVEKYVTTHQEAYLAHFQTICLSAFGAILVGGVLVMIF